MVYKKKGEKKNKATSPTCTHDKSSTKEEINDNRRSNTLRIEQAKSFEIGFHLGRHPLKNGVTLISYVSFFFSFFFFLVFNIPEALVFSTLSGTRYQ